MMRFAADENLDGRILAGLKERIADLDIIRVQDTTMYQAADPQLLEWLASEDRILLTHDLKTMPGFVVQRLNAGLYVPGVIAIKRQHQLSLGEIIAELETMIGAGQPDDFANLILYVPL